MQIDVFATADDVKVEKIRGKVAIVIDAFRATSTVITALWNGCKGVIPAYDIEQAKAKAIQLPPGQYLLGGERNAVMIEGFDLGNSPLEYRSKEIIGKYVILTTTNGTKALHHGSSASKVITAGFLNGEAVVEHILKNSFQDIVIICAGTEGNFSMEDILCAGKIINDLLNKTKDMQCNDLAVAAQNLYQNNKRDMEGLLRRTYHYNKLVSLGFKQDIDYCLQEDICPIIPLFANGVIVPAG
ncbi:MAG: 2-phosphosulfolactate phosphatase [Clostridiaceae bacterium]|nr:2-phosphosulfolactate phosphatase [Clostridiaceae bacterium]